MDIDFCLSAKGTFLKKLSLAGGTPALPVKTGCVDFVIEIPVI
jgi:hypothetical protein